MWSAIDQPSIRRLNPAPEFAERRELVDPAWAEQMGRRVVRVARRLTDPGVDLAAFGSVISALGVQVRVLGYDSHPESEVTASVDRLTLLALDGGAAPMAACSPD